MSVSLVFLSMMNNVAVILRQRLVSDDQGGFITGYAGVAVQNSRIRPASSSEKVEAQREERWITHVLYVPHGTDVRRGDKVIIDDLIVEVQAIREPSKAGHHLEVDCLEREFDSTVAEGS